MSQETAIESFKKFQHSWVEQIHHHLNHLRSVQNHHRNSATGDEQRLKEAVERAMELCREYHRAKLVTTEKDVIGLMAAPWSSALERSLHWVGDWRPTTLFHLVYTESSILFESRIVDILRGFRTGDLSDLSPSQFRTVSELQCETVKEENAITEELSEWQDDASDLVMGTVSDLDQRIRRLGEIVHRADDLRLRTITGVVELLSPLQQAEFLIAAAELRTGVSGWGSSHDRRRSSNV
ncbi:transcription factor-related [Raphanus sativus]|uniref:Protein DELAY OF GERMINATION 1 isoform X2 n=1 Tax=Raphanus sativus TaxID=3726 RepID=A0A6J0NZK7_RAPSA|nr:protein DELAY OF GERMINATION 1 isoform X2 [Raphanus sativus]KAJ4893642.1 transcription factor-related [Raphanus sativus]